MSTSVARKGHEGRARGWHVALSMNMSLIESKTLLVRRFVALRRHVADVRRATAFYCDGLGFHIADNGDSLGEVILALGAQRIILVETRCCTDPTVIGPDVLFQHVAIVASEMRAAFERVQKFAPVAISCGGPQRLPAASGAALAFKFRDPDGHPVELIEFPAGQGAACWRAQSQRAAGPTLGIDHAAISVSDADRSIAFYEHLGFTLHARQINRGIEQAQLDGMAGAAVEVEVVALVPPKMPTPHLELLAYHRPAPTRGRSDVHAAADQLLWQVNPPRVSASRIAEQHHKRNIMDPDGHINWIVACVRDPTPVRQRTTVDEQHHE